MSSHKRLSKKQREALLSWIAEGLETDEINKRAAAWRPRFKVTRQQVDHYRKTREIQLEEIKDAGETNALKAGFAIRENRVRALQTLADRMLAELTRDQDNRFWTQNAKTVGKLAWEYEEFNRAEVDALRGVLDDISAEMGERIRTTAITNPDGSLTPPAIPDEERLARMKQLAILIAGEVKTRAPARSAGEDA